MQGGAGNANIGANPTPGPARGTKEPAQTDAETGKWSVKHAPADGGAIGPCSIRNKEQLPVTQGNKNAGRGPSAPDPTPSRVGVTRDIGKKGGWQLHTLTDGKRVGSIAQKSQGGDGDRPNHHARREWTLPQWKRREKVNAPSNVRWSEKKSTGTDEKDPYSENRVHGTQGSGLRTTCDDRSPRQWAGRGRAPGRGPLQDNQC